MSRWCWSPVALRIFKASLILPSFLDMEKLPKKTHMPNYKGQTRHYFYTSSRPYFKTSINFNSCIELQRGMCSKVRYSEICDWRKLYCQCFVKDRAVIKSYIQTPRRILEHLLQLQQVNSIEIRSIALWCFSLGVQQATWGRDGKHLTVKHNGHRKERRQNVSFFIIK